MLDRWLALCVRLGRSDVAPALASMLEDLYQSPPRAYHSLDHIAACLEVFDAHRALAEQPDAVEFALWLHDCIYDPKAKDNEAKSAAVALEMLRELGAADAVQVHIEALIPSTLHTPTPLFGDAALIADIDLSILATSAPAYASYAAAIRREYSFVPDAVYRPGRSAVLRAFLDRPRIFHTDAFERSHELRARANMEAELLHLA
jgi:predicted metal-dependent HD superfamily phosphohydrolase